MLKPYSNKVLKRLPRNAYAYSRDNGMSWTIRQDEQTAEQVVATGNNQPLRPSDYYLAPVDSVVIVTRQSIATQAERAYESANYWN